MDAFQQLGLGTEPTIDDVKKAFRRLSKKCHPDTRVANAPFEFPELLKIYADALEVVKSRDEFKRQYEEGVGNHTTPSTFPAQPITSETVEIEINSIDEFELMTFGVAYREAIIPAAMKVGGRVNVMIMQYDVMAQGGVPMGGFAFNTWPTEEETVSYRFNVKNGQLDIKLHFIGK
jgi:hypothetical protein